MFLLIWIRVGQGPIALAVGAGGGCLDIFSLVYHFSFLSPSLWETVRYRLKYCLKGPLPQNNQPTKNHRNVVLVRRQDIPQKLTELSPRSHPRHLVGKRTAQKDAIKDTTSDSQVNSCFPYRWPPASLTFNIYF